MVFEPRIIPVSPSQKVMGHPVQWRSQRGAGGGGLPPPDPFPARGLRWHQCVRSGAPTPCVHDSVKPAGLIRHEPRPVA